MRGETFLDFRKKGHVDSGKRAAINPKRSYHAIVAICGSRISGDAAIFPPAAFVTCLKCREKMNAGQFDNDSGETT
jgi:hypothetical protein